MSRHASSEDFQHRLALYKQIIDDDISRYAAATRSTIRQQYGTYVAEAETDVFLDMLERGGKRIRGALVMVGYEMCGGTNKQMIVQAARAIEMIHAYILIIDDIQDRSTLRRGKPTAHCLIEDYHAQHHLKGDAAHSSMSLALMAAISGAHAAQSLLANLDALPQLKLNLISIVNRAMVVTAHGQTLDIMNELLPEPTLEDVERILEWKTALYTITNPLHAGMVLAGAGCEATDAITPYGLHTGKAFQLTDDILGIYGNKQELGKLPGDDIREGKGTLLALYALAHAAPNERDFLRSCLGNAKLTTDDFVRCKQIIESSGALDYAHRQVAEHTAAAVHALKAGSGLWNDTGAAFLRELTVALQHRVK